MSRHDPAAKTIFINDQCVDLDEQATIREALHQYDGRFVAAFEEDAAEIMDADGWPLALDAKAVPSERIYVCLLPWADCTR